MAATILSTNAVPKSTEIPSVLTAARVRQDVNGNSSASHVDGRTKRDGDRVGVRIQSQVLAEFHIDRDIGGRATSEKGCNTTDT